MDIESLYGCVEGENLCEVAKWKQYDETKLKVLFILREPSSRGKNQDYKFKEALENEKWNPKGMWRLLACCSAGFHSIEQKPRYEWKDSDNCRKLLKYSSYMNLKRLGAGTSSNMSLVGLHAGLFWPLMMDEIKELKPNIIVFCGTFTIFEELIRCLNRLPDYSQKFGYKSFGKIEEIDNDIGIWKCNNIIQRPIGLIKMMHPATRKKGVTHKVYFRNLMKLVGKLWENKQIRD